MKKNYITVSDARNESIELTKRLYRGITDVARRLDERRGRAQICDDLFLPSLEAQRVKLREYCERLIFSDPVSYGQKGEDILWRKGYYDVVSTAKRMRKNNTWSPVEIAYIQSHLASGVGHYHHLISRLQIEFKVDLRGMIDFPILVNDEGLMKGKSSSNKTLDTKSIEWAKMAAHRCLVYLGDLNRYFLDIYPHWDTGLTARYYLQALNLNPDVGMPHNQLGSLSGTKNFSLDAAYYYMRCLMCPQPFEGAEGNLQRIFEKNSKWVENQSYESNFMNPSSSQVEHIQCLIARFLLLADIWFFDKTSVPDINELCWNTVEDFKHCLKYSSPFPGELDLKVEIENIDEKMLGEREDETPEYLKHDIIFKMVVILLMCIGKLQSSNSPQHSAAIAFTLGFLALLVDYVINHIQESVFTCSLTSFMCEEPISISSRGSTVDSPVLNSHVPDPQTTDPVHATNTLNVEMNGQQSKTKSKKSSRLRRRRRRPLNSSEDSDVSDGDCSLGGESSSSDADSDISETEEPLASSSDGESGDELSALARTSPDKEPLNGEARGHKIVVEVENHNEIQNKLLNDSVKNGDAVQKNSTTSPIEPELKVLEEESTQCQRNGTIDPADLIELLTEDRVLDAIKVLTDWLKGDPAVIKKCGSSDLFVKIISLLNLINIDADILKKDADGAHIFKLKDIDAVFARVPLPEDIVLKRLCLDSFKHVHEALDWEYLRHHCVHAKEEAVLRVYKLVNFGHFLVSADTGVLFDANTRLFSISAVPSKGSPIHKEGKQSNNPSTDDAKKAPPKNNKGDLLKQMGQLWLRAEVKDLESRVGSRRNFSPYLAIDVDALIHHSRLVKQLVGARKFIILIPSVVVCALDELKRELGKARDSIRWLECQFEKGNRFLRAQRAHERLPIPLIKYPKKKDKEAWLFFQIVECCHFFSQQNGMQARPNTAMVTLLTGHKSCTIVGANDEAVKGFSPMGTAKTAGINFEYIEVFHSRWRSSSKSHG